mgnify:FL=1
MVVCWLLMLALVSGLLLAHRNAWHRLEWLLKPAAAATFVPAGFLAGGIDTTFGRVMLAGLVLAAGGDVLLIPKNKRAFLAGIGAFLAGHVAYAIAFTLRGVDLSAALVCLGGLGLIAIPVLRWLWPHVERPMRLPVVAYVIVITAMVAAAVGTALRTEAWLLLVGAAAFYLSDLSVARDRFVASGFGNRLWGLPLYFFAQMLLASQAGR